MTISAITSSSSPSMAGSSPSTDLTTNMDDLLIFDIEREYKRLHLTYRLIQQIERSLSQGKSLSVKQSEIIRSKHTVRTDLEFYDNLLDKLSKEKSSSSENMSKEKTDVKGDYLCVTDGFMILCLDLKQQCKDESKDYRYELQPLPKIDTLQLLDEGYPVSMGLFKMGPNAYMVGGHGLKDNKYPRCRCSLYKDYTVDNLSRETYLLSLGENNRLSLSKCSSIGPLKEPKLWPIVEKIDKMIHVIESVPPALKRVPRVTPSHEVLNSEVDLIQGWDKLLPVCVSRVPFCKGTSFQYHTWSHLVVGDRIFGSGVTSTQFEIFDSKRGEWELCEISGKHHPHLYSIQHVGQLLSFGFGRCVGRFLQGQLTSEPPLYVVIGLGSGDHIRGIMCAAAYLVTPMGQVLCYQRLPLFFGGFLHFFMGSKGGTVINIDEEGKTFCAIARGMICDSRGCALHPKRGILLVSMFTVEEGLSARTSATSLLTRTTDDIAKLPLAVEQEFVKVVVKDSFAFELKRGDMSNISPRLSASFL